MVKEGGYYGSTDELDKLKNDLAQQKQKFEKISRMKPGDSATYKNLSGELETDWVVSVLNNDNVDDPKITLSKKIANGELTKEINLNNLDSIVDFYTPKQDSPEK